MKKSNRGSESGASAVEYALLIAGIAAVLVVAVYALGVVSGGMFTETCGELDSAAQASASC
jgi:pilus assembly protein Flp/PilA